ncbi:NADH dehydrogenase [ubiquinone] 1 alpha subcomplex subunit 1-like [Diadema setosum]|uniref:NADH dehydrogenase [ubiquinone] 1 alpha subcomplex subunit 1-like n=1 Tax=Diadema setosum TaxID=31175 RepID=UPI003B3A7733
MWYEILPGLAIICGCVSAVGIFTTTVQKFQHGGKARRTAPSGFDYLLIKRDEKIAGVYWKSKGLEALAGVGQKSS